MSDHSRWRDHLQCNGFLYIWSWGTLDVHTARRNKAHSWVWPQVGSCRRLETRYLRLVLGVDGWVGTRERFTRDAATDSPSMQHLCKSKQRSAQTTRGTTEMSRKPISEKSQHVASNVNTGVGKGFLDPSGKLDLENCCLSIKPGP